MDRRVQINGLQCPVDHGVMQCIIAQRANIDSLALSKMVERDGRAAGKIFGLIRCNWLCSRCTEHIKP